ncbi:MAG: peptidoglycan -binding protein [Rhodobacteraceae bacterium]|nr:peptidoglycan -binding protein [Paracoccaceae bacterium]
MARARRSGKRAEANIWPGFVDAMTALLLVIMFVLSIFMIIQNVMRETITGQDVELHDLSAQVAGLAQALGLEQRRGTDLSNQLGQLDSKLSDSEAALQLQTALVASLSNDRDAANVRIASFEEQVAGLITRNTNLNDRNSNLQSSLADVEQTAEDQASQIEAARASIAELDAARDLELTQKEAAQLALARARAEIDVEAEQARLAAAKADALEALVADLETKVDETETELATLSDAEAARLVEAAAAEALRARLLNADTELTAMTLALEEQRQKAEDTLTLLAAAEVAQRKLDNSEAENVAEIDRQTALLEQANDLLAGERALSAESQRQVALLNQQTAALRTQLNSLQGLLDASKAADVEAKVQLQTLGSDLNTALARVAAEQKARAESEQARADLEARERERLEDEAVDLRSFRSEFFGRVREVLSGRDGVQVVGDRFVFSSEVLFAPGSAELGAGGKAQIAVVASVIRDIGDEIPDEINWVLRVDGHTDKIGLGAGSQFADNWELSQARALSVVKYLIEREGIPANRLAATGFGEFQPVDLGNSPEALAANRRIELKLTEK